MNRKQINSVMIVLSLVYAATIGLLATLGSSAVGTASIVGAAVLGLGWSISGFLANRQSE
jgi:hypothetical protein